MKSKIYKTMAAVAAVAMLASCGGDAEETDGTGDEVAEETIPGFADECTGENDITFKVERYGYQYDSTYTDDRKIEVVRSTWEMTNDSVAVLNLYNYEEGAADTTTNYNISATLRTHNGVVIGAGQYPYSGGYQDDYALSITINNSLGKVYFNWAYGMPEQGVLDLTFADEDGACGSFDLEVNKPESTTYGHVVLKGKFSTL